MEKLKRNFIYETQTDFRYNLNPFKFYA